MAIPTIVHDLWLLYLAVAIMIVCYFFSWVWKMIAAKWPIENWLVADQPDPPPPAIVKVVEFPLLSMQSMDDENDNLTFEVISGDMYPAGMAEKLAEEIHANWVADYGELTPLPDFLNDSGKNNTAYEKALVGLRLA